MDRAAEERARGLLRAILTPEEWDWYERTGGCRFGEYHFLRTQPEARYDLDSHGRVACKRHVFLIDERYCDACGYGHTKKSVLCFEDVVVTSYFHYLTDPARFSKTGCHITCSIAERDEVERRL